MKCFNPTESRFTCTRLVGIGISLAITAWCGFYAKDIPASNHSEILNGVLTAFPVFLGFFLTVMSIIGTLDNSGTILFSAQLKIYRSSFESKLLLNAFIAICYFIEIALALILRCLTKNSICYDVIWPIFIGLGAFSCMASLLIPSALYSLYRDRYLLIEIAVLQRESPKEH